MCQSLVNAYYWGCYPISLLTKLTKYNKMHLHTIKNYICNKFYKLITNHKRSFFEIILSFMDLNKKNLFFNLNEYLINLSIILNGSTRNIYLNIQATNKSAQFNLILIYVEWIIEKIFLQFIFLKVYEIQSNFQWIFFVIL